jgi:hypothetical protein
VVGVTVTFPAKRPTAEVSAQASLKLRCEPDPDYQPAPEEPVDGVESSTAFSGIFLPKPPLYRVAPRTASKAVFMGSGFRQGSSAPRAQFSCFILHYQLFRQRRRMSASQKGGGMNRNDVVRAFHTARLLKISPISQHENEEEIIVKFGVGDQLRNTVNQLQTLLYAA